MAHAQPAALAAMLVELAAVPAPDQIDTLVELVRTWIEREQPGTERRQRWLAAELAARARVGEPAAR
jgi:hypothetical protein